MQLSLNVVLGSLVVGGLLVSTGQGAIKTWTGAAGDNDYGNTANWSPSRPNNNDWEDEARFSSSGTPGVLSLITNYSGDTTPQHDKLTFLTAGWTIAFKYQDLGVVSSAGAGTNTLQQSFEQQQAATFTIGADNTLMLAGGYYQRNHNVNLIGGGVLQIGAQIQGFGSGTWGFHVKENTTLRVMAAQPYHSAAVGKAYIGDATGRLELLTTVANANVLISGGKIVDETGLGLSVTDIGGGYVSIQAAAVPEPATMALVALATSALLARRRRA